MRADLIAPCGMNCALCMVFQREKKPCGGCGGPDKQKPAHCLKCAMKGCAQIKWTADGFAHTCGKFPCRRLKQFDARYRQKYHMSVIDNLERIEEAGMEVFLNEEEEKWICPECGALLCVHFDVCQACKSYQLEEYR